MPDFKQTFQDEVRRLARKELKAFEAKINEQKKTINALQKRVNDLEKKQAAAPAAVRPASDAVQAAAPDGVIPSKAVQPVPLIVSPWENLSPPAVPR